MNSDQQPLATGGSAVTSTSPPVEQSDKSGPSPSAGIPASQPVQAGPTRAEEQAPQEQRGFEFPTAYTILFLLLVVMAALTCVVPAGQYDGVRDLLGVALVVGLARGVFGHHEQRPDHRRGAQLGRAPRGKPGWRRHHQHGGVAILAAVVPDPVFLRPGDRNYADRGAEFAGVPKSLIVTAYQSANGLINLVTPTFAVVAGGSVLGRVPLNTWWRFSMPLVLMLAAVIVLVLSTGVLIRT